MNRNRLASCGWLTLSAALFGMDFLSKRWAEAVLKGSGQRIIVPGILGLRYAENTGAAFSALSNATGLLSIISIAVCVAVAVYMVVWPQRWFVQLPLSAILAGGLGNLMDRITRGYVVDYFEFLFMRFAIFNVADVCITVGAAALVLVMLVGGDKVGQVDRR